MTKATLGEGISSICYPHKGGVLVATAKVDWLSKLFLYLMQGQPYIPKIKDIYIDGDELCREMTKYNKLPKGYPLAMDIDPQDSIAVDPEIKSMPTLTKTLRDLQQKVYDFDAQNLVRWDLIPQNFMLNPQTNRLVLIDPLVTRYAGDWGSGGFKKLMYVTDQLVEALEIKRI